MQESTGVAAKNKELNELRTALKESRTALKAARFRLRATQIVLAAVLLFGMMMMRLQSSSGLMEQERTVMMSAGQPATMQSTTEAPSGRHVEESLQLTKLRSSRRPHVADEGYSNPQHTLKLVRSSSQAPHANWREAMGKGKFVAQEHDPFPNFKQANDLAQESLFQSLSLIWGNKTDRVILDLGSQAGFGSFLQYDDALIFLEYFHHGGMAVAVDGFEDFAQDVQHRFDDLEPWKSMSHISKKSLNVLIANQDGPPVDFSFPIKMHRGYCGGHSFDGVQYKALEDGGIHDHLCRITRQRYHNRNYSLQLPPQKLADQTKVPVRSIDSIWKHELQGRHIDFFKIDIDRHWKDFWGGMQSLWDARAFSVMLIEVDYTWRRGPGSNLTRAVDAFVDMLERNDYAAFMKVPCGVLGIGGKKKPLHELRRCMWGACEFNTAKNRSVVHEYLFKISHERRRYMPPLIKLQQDILVIDARQPELFDLEILMRNRCGRFYGRKRNECMWTHDLDYTVEGKKVVGLYP